MNQITSYKQILAALGLLYESLPLLWNSEASTFTLTMTTIIGAIIIIPKTLAKITKDLKTQRQFTDLDMVILVGISAKKVV
jgi:hypothetical protein